LLVFQLLLSTATNTHCLLLLQLLLFLLTVCWWGRGLCLIDRSMFTSEMSECHQRVVTIYDVDEAAFTALIEFAYTARITLTTDNVQTLLYACSILQVSEH